MCESVPSLLPTLAYTSHRNTTSSTMDYNYLTSAAPLYGNLGHHLRTVYVSLPRFCWWFVASHVDANRRLRFRHTGCCLCCCSALAHNYITHVGPEFQNNTQLFELYVQPGQSWPLCASTSHM